MTDLFGGIDESVLRCQGSTAFVLDDAHGWCEMSANKEVLWSGGCVGGAADGGPVGWCG